MFGEPDGQPYCTAAELDGLLDPDEVDWQWTGVRYQLGLAGRRKCTLRRFNAHQARTCLAGRPLVFMGDCIAR